MLDLVRHLGFVILTNIDSSFPLLCSLSLLPSPLFPLPLFLFYFSPSPLPLSCIIDMNLFTTSTLIKQCGDHDVETREQVSPAHPLTPPPSCIYITHPRVTEFQNLQAPNENWDITGKKPVWKCESNRLVAVIYMYMYFIIHHYMSPSPFPLPFPLSYFLSLLPSLSHLTPPLSLPSLFLPSSLPSLISSHLPSLSHISSLSPLPLSFPSLPSSSTLIPIRSLTTVQEYGEYQLSVIEEERQGGIQMDRRILKFGTNCDLSDKNK